MWSPWRVSLITGLAAGCGSALPQWDLDPLLILTATISVAVAVCLLVRLGLWLSKRPSLPLVPALALAVVALIIAMLSSLPIETHAKLVDSPAVLTDQAISMRSAYLLGLGGFALPAIAAFFIGRLFGLPPNTSLERSRDR